MNNLMVGMSLQHEEMFERITVLGRLRMSVLKEHLVWVSTSSHRNSVKMTPGELNLINC